MSNTLHRENKICLSCASQIFTQRQYPKILATFTGENILTLCNENKKYFQCSSLLPPSLFVWTLVMHCE